MKRLVTFICDTRQKRGKHKRKHEWMESHGICLVPCALPYGDYALPPKVSVDTKASIAELHANLTVQYDRFRRELMLARDCGASLVVLVENDCGIRSLADFEAWTEPEWMMRKRKGVKPINGHARAEQMRTIQQEYGCFFAFCGKEEAGFWVAEILAHPDEVVIDEGFISRRPCGT